MPHLLHSRIGSARLTWRSLRIAGLPRLFCVRCAARDLIGG